MADKKNQAQGPDAQPTGPDAGANPEQTPPVVDPNAPAPTQEQLAAQQQAQIQAEAEAKKLDETVEGGRYIVDRTRENPQGRVVDANGKTIDEGK